MSYGLLTPVSVMTGARVALAARGVGLSCRNTLSPDEFGFVCVPWKWTFVLIDSLKQSGYLSAVG